MYHSLRIVLRKYMMYTLCMRTQSVPGPLFGPGDEATHICALAVFVYVTSSTIVRHCLGGFYVI